MKTFRLSTALTDDLFENENDEAPKWVQVARTGKFLGYAGGTQPFVLDRRDLDQMVRNIKEHPSYQLGPDGSPVGDVIPWDFNHGSEMHPLEGNFPIVGAPSMGWTRDLKVLEGNGVAELWALTKFLEPARTYIRMGQYKWASCAVSFNATDPVSGRNQGTLITSIALTNTPFIEGMQKLVASKGVPTESEVGKTQDAADAARKQKDQEMSVENSKVLASLLGVRDNEEAVQAAVKDLQALRDGLSELFSKPNAAADVLLASAREAAKARAKLTELFTAMQLDNADSAVEKVAELMTNSAKLTELMPELASLRKDKEAAEARQVESDVASVIASKKLTEDVRDALLLFRKQQPEAFAAKYPKAEEAPKADDTPAYLTKDVAVTKTGAPVAADKVQPPAGNVIDLSNYQGENPTQRAMAYLSATDKEWSRLTHEDRFLRAVNLKRRPDVVDTLTAKAPTA